MDEIQVGMNYVNANTDSLQMDMMGIDLNMSDEELMHWGIKGQKWGVRRYQNKDGSLTPAGQKRYNQEVDRLMKEKSALETKQKNLRAQQRMKARTDKLRADIDELKGKKKKTSPEKVEEPAEKKEGKRLPRFNKKDDKPKNPKDMTSEELAEAINKMRLEQQYNQLYSQLNPPKVNRGAEIAKQFIDESVLPAAKGLAKDYMTKLGKEALGLNEKAMKSELEKLTEQFNTEVMKQKLAEAKKAGKKDTSEIDELTEQLTKATLEKQIKDARGEKSARDQAFENLQREAAEAEALGKREKGLTEAAKQQKEREKLFKPDEPDIEAENKKKEAQIKNEKLNDPEYQRKQKEHEIAKFEQTITNAKKGKSTEELVKDYMKESNLDLSSEEKRRIEDMIDDGSFWAAIAGKL